MSSVPKPHTPRGWLLVIAVELILIGAVIGLFFGLQHQGSRQDAAAVRQRASCVSINHTNGAITDILNRSIKASRAKRLLDVKKHDTASVKLDDRNIGSGITLRAKFSQIDCGP